MHHSLHHELCAAVLGSGLLGAPTALAQVLSPQRSTDWGSAGLRLEVPEPTITVDITAFGGAGDGVTPNGAALAAAFAALQGQMGVVYFPPGDFLFTSTILMPDSTILRGATADSTTLTFTLGGAGYCIAAMGQEEAQQFPLNLSSPRGSAHLWTATTEGLVHGDEIRLYRDDAALVVSAWALGTAGQIARITTIEPDGVGIASPLRAHFGPGNASYFRRLRPVRYAGIECMKIVRTDAAPPDEWSNIWFSRASHCWVKGVESDKCNFAHIEFFASTNCEVSGCYLHHAFAYGGGGQGYGVLAYYTSGENLIQDNIFERLRHSMIVQAGANGNVFAYNRSVDPFWSQFPLPSNAAGEIVLHGDHPYLNLFEGNVVQNIVIDDSHGRNGPFNTLFRNRTLGWGVFMNNAPATDSVNFIGNEISGSPGLYSLNGNGHFQYGNNVLGTMTPTGTGDLLDESYYLSGIPNFLLPVGALPQIGPNSTSPGTIPAAQRLSSGEGFTLCSGPDISTGFSAVLQGEVRCYPVPFHDRFTIERSSAAGISHLVIRNALGTVVLQQTWPAEYSRLEISGIDLPAGVYIVDLHNIDQGRRSMKVISE